ncbi:MAG: A/G-specific DNA-adenine glycosylase [Bryobacterales bacterium]|nr:A/G-specific DNA-adenine glycosylase [Bryobacterales bacterium]
MQKWYQREHRDLPWRSTRDPYSILVSEFMLQQTRAQTVIPYYHRFLQQFPDVRSLASAREAAVLACWSGLGYYSRARNLQKAARVIAGAGGFPSDYDDIRALPGVGPYTAAAVASIAFDSPHAVLDGNVIRVIARLRGDGSDIAAVKTRAHFQQIADELLDRRHPGNFNQAIMELGATICLPKAPRCSLCPVARLCEARNAGRQHEFPVKRPKPSMRLIRLQVAIVEKNGMVLLRRRAAGESLMAGFWELPAPEDLRTWRQLENIGLFRHTITHHRYIVSVFTGHITKAPEGYRWRRQLDGIPLTTITRKALRLFMHSR